MRLPRHTARLRLAALYGGLFFLSGAALLAATYVLFRQATEVRPPHLPKVPHTPTIQKLEPPLPAYALPQLRRFQYQLAQTQHQLSLRVTGGTPPFASPQLGRDQRRLTRDQQQLAKAVHQLAQAVRDVAQARTAQAAQRESDSHELVVDSGIALAVVGFLALVAGWLVAGRMLRPIRTITHAARRISSSSLHERLALAGPQDELKELGDTLDDLFARLEAAFDAQRNFVANASHELRTPLTRERTLVQVALGDPSTSEVWRSAGEELLASNREQESLIDALLTLAGSESELDRRERVDLAEICKDVLARAGLDAARLGLRLETDIRPALVDGDPRLIERMVVNLVDNAVGHNVTDGRVLVCTATTDGRAILAVTNSGPVVPAGELDRLFQPFQRLDGKRTHSGNGHGLGLSIVRAVAAAHDATITAEPLPDGGLLLHRHVPAPRRQRSQRFTPRTLTVRFGVGTH